MLDWDSDVQIPDLSPNAVAIPFIRPAGLRTSRFRFRTPALLGARAWLFADRLELTGWHLRGRYRRTIALRQILQADVQGQDSLLLWLSNGETLRLHIEGASAWQATIALQQSRLENATL